MRVVGLQADLAWEDVSANHAALGRRVRDVAEPGSLVVLPETWPTAFSMRADLQEPPGGRSERLMRELAAETGATIGGSIPVREAGAERGRNVFHLVRPDGHVDRYAKIHPFTFGKETTAFRAGDEVITVAIDGLRVTPFVCYDLRFAELFTTAAAQTDLFVVIANWPEARAAHWRALLLARAIETQAYVLGVNRVGSGGGLTYRGDSQLVSPLGEVLGSLPPGVEGAVGGEVDPAVVADVRERLPFLSDRRPAIYRGL